MVVMRIEKDREAVGFRFAIAARQLPRDFCWLTVVQPHADVQCLLVVRNTQLGPFRRGFPLIGLSLRELGRRRRAEPDLLVELAVDDNRSGGSNGMDDGCAVRRAGLSGRRSRDGAQENEDGTAQHDARSSSVRENWTERSSGPHRMSDDGLHTIMMSSLVRDLRHGVRALTRAPGFTIMAVAVLALGIGGNATIFSVTNALFLRPLPVASPGTLVRVYSNRYSNTAYRTFLELRDRNSTLTGLIAFQLHSFGLRVDRDVEQTFGEIVSGEYFPLLGIRPARGRLLAPSDDTPGAPPVAVLSHAFWMRRFGGSPDVIGRTIGLNGQPFTIVGIAEQSFTGVMTPLRGELWVPLATDAVLRPALDPAIRLDTTSLHLIGRLRPGVDRARAQADLDAIGRQLREAAGETVRERAVTVYGSTMLHPEISGPITAFVAILMAVVGLVLLIVCVNVANLVLARAAGRTTELAIRQSLGAGRGRLVRQMLTENLLLAGAGAAGGVAIAVWCTRLATKMRIPAPVPLVLDLAVDVRVLAFTTLVAVGATLAFGLIPALSASRVDLVSTLKNIAGEGPRHRRLRSAFLVAQVSMSVLLLIVAGLFIRSFRAAQSIDVGFDTTNVLTASIDLETRGYSEQRGNELLGRIVERLEATPGVIAANAVDIVPVTLSNTTNYLLRDGDPEPAPNQPPSTPMIYQNAVGPGHFRTLRIPLVAGRDFTHQDRADGPRVAIVNETLAKRFWPGKEAVGQHLRPIGGSARDTVEVIGVARDSKYVTLGEGPRPFLYRPLTQSYTPRITLIVRSAGGPASALSPIKDAVRAFDSDLPVFNVSPLAEATAISLLPVRLAGGLLSAVGAFALGLAALGIYGVLSFLVRARTREIGIRVAIGAAPRSVTMLVVRQALTWTVAGALIGIGLAFALTGMLSSFLYGISPVDPLTFAGVTLLLAAVACVASFAPAMQASRVDPLVALRDL
jgi:predicted permease